MLAKTQTLAFVVTKFMKYTQETNTDVHTEIKFTKDDFTADIDRMRDAFTRAIA